MTIGLLTLLAGLLVFLTATQDIAVDGKRVRGMRLFV